MIGFLMPNIKIKTGLNNFVKSVDEIEEITGIDFFYNLPDADENFLESFKKQHGGQHGGQNKLCYRQYIRILYNHYNNHNLY